MRSGRRDSDPRLPAWEASTLPLSYSRKTRDVPPFPAAPLIPSLYLCRPRASTCRDRAMRCSTQVRVVGACQAPRPPVVRRPENLYTCWRQQGGT